MRMFVRKVMKLFFRGCHYCTDLTRSRPDNVVLARESNLIPRVEKDDVDGFSSLAMSRWTDDIIIARSYF